MRVLAKLKLQSTRKEELVTFLVDVCKQVFEENLAFGLLFFFFFFFVGSLKD